MLNAAGDKDGVDIDVKERLSDDSNEENSSRKIAAFFGESVFHSGRMVEEDGLQDDDVFVNFGDNPQEKIAKELDKQLREAAQKVLPNAEVQQLKASIEKHKVIFRLKIGSGGPANTPNETTTSSYQTIREGECKEIPCSPKKVPWRIHLTTFKNGIYKALPKGIMTSGTTSCA